MLLDELQFDRLQVHKVPNTWGVGDKRTQRQLFYDPEGQLFIKTWGSEYEHAYQFWRGRRLVRSDLLGLFGFAIGFFSREIGSAFVECIEDKEGRCRGYVTRAGTPLIGRDDPRFDSFLEAV